MSWGKLKIIEAWTPPAHWQKIVTLDAHTGGEPLRIYLSGLPKLEGSTILKRRRYMHEHLDHLRTALMWEPRGHADQYGCIITPPVTEGADFGVLFLHNEGYSTMCGHAIIAVTKIAVETGMIPMQAPVTTVKIDAPAGLITSYARIENGHVKNVYFHNVPSFLYAKDEIVNVPGLGEIRYDIAFGGAFYAYVKAEDANVGMTGDDFRELIEKGMAIKRAVMAATPLKHPVEEDLNFLYGTIFYGPALSENADSRNVCIFAEGEVDRSPTGTGVSGRMALHHFKGELEINQPMIIESIIGSSFKATAIKNVTFGPHEAVIAEVDGNAHITGINTFYIDPDDPLRHGFILR
ncbi:proline racemase family protein [bacterium]|nr:proline racemase family protein [bacterium]